MVSKTSPDTYLAEDAGLRFWALRKETVEQLKIQNQKTELPLTSIWPLVSLWCCYITIPSIILVINIVVLLLYEAAFNGMKISFLMKPNVDIIAKRDGTLNYLKKLFIQDYFQN